ncbi:uncharacterized [Tachysurus ichikawai]
MEGIYLPAPRPPGCDKQNVREKKSRGFHSLPFLCDVTHICLLNKRVDPKSCGEASQRTEDRASDAEHITEELIKAERVEKWEANEAPKWVIQV